jgi:DGQHR domain-containing protein
MSVLLAERDMLTNVRLIEDLGSLARANSREYETKTVSHSAITELQQDGWEIAKRNKKSVRLKRAKRHGALLEDRVWTLLYRMEFRHLSGKGGAQLQVNASEETPTSQIDVVALDDEVAIAIECKSSEQSARRPQFQQELGKHSLIRERFTTAARKEFDPPARRLIVLAMFTSNIVLSENDKLRAKEANIVLLDEQDLNYYETLVAHIGPAARYQLLAELLPGKTVPNLEIKVPAIRAKMGGANCYTFSISPEYLLKIAYVSHRAKGKASDVNTYQRMLSKGRLNKIRQYIDDDGIFPTNIVLNLEKNKMVFQRSLQDEDASTEHAIAGWLDIKATYKCAWIIDGQHRLFAYSGHPKAPKSRVAVLAFEGLAASDQARLFIDINAKQKSVKQSLLEELYAELHWDAADDSIRVLAIISKAVQELGSDPESPLAGRVLTADSAKSDIRCITYTSLYSAIGRTEFHLGKVRHNIPEYGPLWAGTNEATLKRTVYVLKHWFDLIKAAVPDWWDKGAGEGGGLAMNDGVTTCIMVLRSVFQHSEPRRLLRLDDEDIFHYIRKYAEALGAHFAKFTESDRKMFRDLRGVQGQTRRWRKCQEALREAIPSFNPEGLDKYLAEEKDETNTRGKSVIEFIEKTLQKIVLDELMSEMPEGEDWWLIGVPKLVRQKVTQKYEDDDHQRGGYEYYFDLIDYPKIALHNWQIFQPILGYGSGGKEKQLSWLNFVNLKRNIVSHASSGKTLTIEELDQLEQYGEWLRQKKGELMDTIHGAAEPHGSE